MEEALQRRWWWEAVLAVSAAGVLSLGLYLYNTLWVRPERTREKLRRQGIKGPLPSLVLGNIPQMKRIQGEEEKARKAGRQVPANYSSFLFPYLDRWTKEYGPLFVYSTGNMQILHVSHPHLVKEIGLCKSLDLGKPSYLHKERGALLGRGILASNGAAWAHQRKVISPELFMAKVKGMVGLIIEATIPLLSSWERKIESDGDNVELFVDEDLRIFSMEVISRACFGSNYLKGKEIFSRLQQLQKVMSKSSLFIGIPGLRHLPTKTNREIWRLSQEIRSLILNVAKQRSERPSDSSVKDLLQSIINSAGTGPDIADDFIVDNCKSIYFAGHETTAVSAAWCLMLLGSHPEWQAKARAEVFDVCGSQTLDANMLSKMKVVSNLNRAGLFGTDNPNRSCLFKQMVTMVIQETLRLYPPASFVIREAFQEMKLGDVVIPKGLTMRILITNLHRDPEIWGPDVNEFNPGRFAQGVTGACKLPHMYMPFGVGARTCAGQNFATIELKIIISMLLLRFSFTLSPKYIHSPAFSLTVKPGFGVPLVLKKI